MGILRDVIARFDVTADTSELDKLNKKMNQARENVNAMAKGMAAAWAAAGAGAYYLVNAASDANESMNVLRQTFKENSDEVVAWSQNLAKQIGRSEYTLQEAAGRFGAFLQPVFRGSSQDIAKMSEQLTALAVDLSSFYNTSEEEAIMRLFSGMSGETEAVRRLGIDISDTSLDALNKENGDNRRLASLTLQEKTLLRFQKIIKDTAEKQGDAARTAGDFANTMRRLQEQVKYLAVEMGQALMPAAMKLTHWLEDKAIPLLKDLGQTSTVLGSALELLVGATGVLAASWLALNPSLVLAGAAFAGIIALYDDLRSFQQGGNSIIGDFIQETTGTNDPLKWFSDQMQEVVGKFDMAIARLQDFGIELQRKFFGGYDGPIQLDNNGKVINNQAAAERRASAGKQNEASRESSFQQALLDAAAREDYGAFPKIFKQYGHTMPRSAQEMNNLAKGKRAQALRAQLSIPTETDVAEGLASQPQYSAGQGPLVKGANAGNGLAREAVSQGAFPNSPMDNSKTPFYQMNVHIDKVEGDPNKLTGALDQHLRNAKAIVGEKKQAQ
jgi:hypothetical protein